MANKFLLIALLSLFFLTNSTLYAEKYQVITTHEPPLNFSLGNISSAHDDQITGFTTDIIREIMKRTNNSTVIELLPWARAYQMVQKKKNVFLFSMSRTEKRENMFNWVGPIAIKKILFFAKKGSGIVIDSLEDAKKVERIGTLREDSKEQYLKRNGFTNTYSNNSWHSALKMLMKERVSLLTQTDLDIAPVAKEVGVDLEKIEAVYTIKTSTLYIGVSKTSSNKVVKQWQSVLDDIKKDGTFEHLIRKWAKYYNAPNWQFKDGTLQIE